MNSLVDFHSIGRVLFGTVRGNNTRAPQAPCPRGYRGSKRFEKVSTKSRAVARSVASGNTGEFGGFGGWLQHKTMKGRDHVAGFEAGVDAGTITVDNEA